MSRITLTPELKALLAGAAGRVELCDENGNPLGYFEPRPPDVKGGWGPFTAEEVDAAFKQTGPTCTLDDILREAGML
jgi:hypothetical protein